MSTVVEHQTGSSTPVYLNGIANDYYKNKNDEGSRRASLISSTHGTTDFETAPNTPLRSSVSLVTANSGSHVSVNTIPGREESKHDRRPVMDGMPSRIARRNFAGGIGSDSEDDTEEANPLHLLSQHPE